MHRAQPGVLGGAKRIQVLTCGFAALQDPWCASVCSRGSARP